jgi:hypothetical protein
MPSAEQNETVPGAVILRDVAPAACLLTAVRQTKNVSPPDIDRHFVGRGSPPTDTTTSIVART